MSEVNFNSFKGIRGMNNAAGGSVCEYLNMIPTGDTAITRQGEIIEQAWYIENGNHDRCFHREVKDLVNAPFTVATGSNAIERTARLLSSHSWNDQYIYYVWYVTADPTDTSSSVKYCPCYVFEVVDVDAKKVYTNTIIMERAIAAQSQTAVDLNPFYENLKCSWARSTTASSSDFRETFFCDGISIYLIRENGNVRYFPSPADEIYIESVASRETTEQLENACTTFSGAEVASCYTFKMTYMDKLPNMEIAFFDNRLAVLYKNTNQLFLSKADPCEILGLIRNSEGSITYAAGFSNWFDCTNKVAKLWPYYMSSSSTSELAQHIATIGDLLVVVNENTTELFTRTGDNSSPITSTVGSVIPFGSSIEPLYFGGKLYICGKDAMGSPVLLAISSDGSTSVISNVEVSKYLPNVTRLETYRCNEMEHILCITSDNSLATVAMAYCVSNGTWWRYKDQKTLNKNEKVFRLGLSEAITNFVGSHYCKHGWYGRMDLEYRNLFPETFTADSYFRLTFTESSSSTQSNPTYTVLFGTKTYIVKYQLSNGYNGSIRTGTPVYPESLTECFTTFSKRAIISSVALRESTSQALITDGITKPCLEYVYELLAESAGLSAMAAGALIDIFLADELEDYFNQPETESLQVSYDRGKTFNTAKTRSLNGGRNDKEIIWRGLGSGNSMTLKFTHASEKPTQIYAIDINIQ